jgi:alcohol dehydrogenase
MPTQNSVWQFATAANIRFGRGSIAMTTDDVARYHIRRPMLVVDKTIAAFPQVIALTHSIKQSIGAVHVFDACVPEPTVAVAEAAIAFGHEVKCDGVIGIGGGSNLDVAKIAATALKHGGTPSSYFGFDAIPGPILPLIALPTTAGTGSEVSHSAVLTDPNAQVKVSTLSRWLRPTVAIIDPSLTDTCPPQVTAHSGIDALVHAIEALTNRKNQDLVGVDPQSRAYEGSYPLTRLVASEAIRLIGRFLVRAYRQPNDTEARDGMAMAAMLAGMAFSNSGVAIVHALEYPIGVLTHCSHGEGNGLLLPHVMRFNLPACTEQMAEIATFLGCSIPPNSSAESAAEAAIGAITDLQRRAEDIPLAAHRAFQIKRLMDINPRLPTELDLIEILRQAF